MIISDLEYYIQYSMIMKLYSDLESSAYIIINGKSLWYWIIIRFRWLEKIMSFRWSGPNISCWKHALIFLSAVFITTTKNGVTKWRNQLYNTVHIKKFKWLIMMIKLILVIWLWSMSLIIYSHDWKNLESSHFCWGCKLILTDSRQIFRPFQFFR